MRFFPRLPDVSPQALGSLWNSQVSLPSRSETLNLRPSQPRCPDYPRSLSRPHQRSPNISQRPKDPQRSGSPRTFLSQGAVHPLGAHGAPALGGGLLRGLLDTSYSVGVDKEDKRGLLPLPRDSGFSLFLQFHCGA